MLTSRSTRDEFIALLEQAGNDPHTFNERSSKTLDNFFAEIAAGEATLEYDGTTLIRRAKSVKLIIRTLDGWRLLEEFRLYPDKPPVVKTVRFGNILLPRPNWSVSETAKPKEHPLETIIRGIREELQWHLSVTFANDKLKPLFPGFGPMPDRHTSSVYAGVESVVETEWLEWVVPERGATDTMVYRDRDGNTSVELHLKWEHDSKIGGD